MEGGRFTTGKIVKKTTLFIVCSLVVIILAVMPCYGFDDDFDGQNYEEPGGASFTVFAGSESGVYGLSLDEGIWIKGLPVFGNISMSLFHNDHAQSLFSGIGMTIRVMPRGTIAPFVGGGGSFNYSWSSSAGTGGTSAIPAEAIAQEAVRKGSESYWSGHAETGIRLCFESAIRLVEVSGRYTWSSAGSDANYWLIGISTGFGW